MATPSNGEDGVVLRISHWRESFFDSRNTMVLPRVFMVIIEMTELS
jgi:hypothetical protein